jgi:hypothetical protein
MKSILRGSEKWQMITQLWYPRVEDNIKTVM